MKHACLLVVFVLILASGVWCIFELHFLMDTSGKMVGMHPIVIFALPAGIVFSLIGMAIAVTQKSFVCSVLSLIPVILMAAPIFFAYNLGIAGWSAAVREHSVENQLAIEGTDFSQAQYERVPYKDDARIVPVADFIWPNATEMSAAKNGIYYGFAIDGIPHVYVCPLRNGCRGVAWLTDTDIIGQDESVRYEYTGEANWYIWTFSP